MARRGHAGLALCALLCCPPTALASPPAAPVASPRSVLFILIDTLRSDHLGCYGYSRDTSPKLDALSRDGVLFENVFSVAPWTNPAIASLFSGVYPQRLMAPALHDEARRQPLPERVDTLAELLQRSGYRTIALMDHPGLSPKLSYDQGFDVFVRLHKKFDSETWIGTDPALVLREFEQQLDAAGAERFFFYVHLVYPHRPYEPPAPYAGMFGEGFKEIRPDELPGMINFYDSEIRQTDDLVGQLMDALKQRGLDDTTAALITSDHGEAFGEHGIAEHGNSLYNEVLRVPLIVTGVWPARRVATRASNIDVFPTVLEIAGVAAPPDIDGSSLSRLLESDAGESEEWLFSQSPHSGDILAHSVIHKGLKYILDKRPGYPRHLLFDLDRNPKEDKSFARRSRETGKMNDRVMRFRRANTEARQAWVTEPRELSEETRRQLEALGYTEDEFDKSLRMNELPTPEPGAGDTEPIEP